jgi:hypothetical protein
MEDTINIDNRADFVLWAVDRAKEIMGREASDLAIAARDGEEETMRAAGNALGQAITDAMVEVFDSLVGDLD